MELRIWHDQDSNAGHIIFPPPMGSCLDFGCLRPCFAGSELLRPGLGCCAV